MLGRPTGDDVQAAAAEILQNQAYERGQMYAWLAAWGESTAPPTRVMDWMGTAVPLAEMPGLASDAEMLALSTLEGRAQGREFLVLMRAHHVGGVQMAKAAAKAKTSVARRLAEQMAVTQTYEIEVMDQLLAGEYRTT